MERGPVRVAMMADTHGVLRPEVEKILETCDVIVHADAVYEIKRKAAAFCSKGK